MAKKTNDQVILEKIISAKCAESENEFSISEFFEIFSASEILKNYGLTYDDIKYGIVGNGGDGGIDSIYILLNGELLKEDTEINVKQKKNHIELVVIQSKVSSSFSESAVVKFRETAEDLLDLSNDPSDFLSRYNSELIDSINIFRATHSSLMTTLPILSIKFYYVSQGIKPDPKVAGKVQKLESIIKFMFSGSDFRFEFVGAVELLNMYREVPSTTRTLEFTESSIGTEAGSYVCLVTLSNYFDFISDNGALARSIFESNVRDYQGNVVVNSGIRQTLQNLNSDNFWYLNNGVTIITPKALSSGRKLVIEDPQIVNGLQTSFEIHKHFAEMETPEFDDRTVLVRIICEEGTSARDRIIRATNSQTNIPPTSLRSADTIHRNIEDFLKSNGYFYDRRKNFYKNLGKPISKIISIPYLAQAMMSITLQKPDSARARPSTLINSEVDYERLFGLDIPIDVYLKVIQIMVAVEEYLKPDNCGQLLERKTITNIKFYVAMLVGMGLTGQGQTIIRGLANLPSVSIPKSLLEESLAKVLDEYTKLGETDQVAKGPNLVGALLAPNVGSAK